MKEENKPLPLSHTPFGGENAEEYNALRSALSTAAKLSGHTGEYAEYDWIENVARTSLVCELVQALHKHGYRIKSEKPIDKSIKV